jgi:cell division protein ZapA (FtsZ GTPase activity inhibitor)
VTSRARRARRTVHVEVAGQRLAIGTDEPEGYVQELAAHVDTLVKELAGGRTPTTHLPRVALLAAIRLADELLRERDRYRRFEAGVQQRLAAVEDAVQAHARHLEE